MHIRLVSEVPNLTHMGRAPVFWGSATPPLQSGRGLSTPQFWGFLSIYADTFYRRTKKFHVMTRGMGVYLNWGQPRLTSQEIRVPGLPNFGVLLYLCPHPLKQNDQIRHGNTYGERTCFRRSAMPLHLHKCVARFVSDSCVSYATY